jgi:hypothetical protein
MTLAVANSTPTKAGAPQTVPIVILGTDAVLAALPATAVQLAHACMESGFASVIPASWGDELIAAATLRRLPEFGSGPVIQCSCPIVAHRLLSVSGDLRPVLLPLVPPPVALARYVRARTQPNRPRVTYVGSCPGAVDDSIDIRMSPEALLSMLAERDIRLDTQPRVFESFIPADRRRFWSQPGGIPTTDALWSEEGARTLIEISGDDFASEVAQQVLAGHNILIDAATKLGCVCSGAVNGMVAKEARSFLVSLEPPRAAAAVVDVNTPIDLDLRIPAASRTPVDVMSVPAIPAPTYAIPSRNTDPEPTRDLSPPMELDDRPEIRPIVAEAAPHSAPEATSPARPTEAKEGRTLRRAYVARRRLTPRSVPIVPRELRAEAETSKPNGEPERTKSNAHAVAQSVETVRAIEILPTDPAHSDDLLESADAADATMVVDAPNARTPTDLTADIRHVHLTEPARIGDVVSVATVAAMPVPHEPESARKPARPDTVGSIPRVDQTDRVAVDPIVTPRDQPKTREAIELMPARINEPGREYVRTGPPTTPLNPRNVVFILLAVVAIAALTAIATLMFFERRFAPHVTAPTSNDH